MRRAVFSEPASKAMMRGARGHSKGYKAMTIRQHTRQTELLLTRPCSPSQRLPSISTTAAPAVAAGPRLESARYEGKKVQ